MIMAIGRGTTDEMHNEYAAETVRSVLGSKDDHSVSVPADVGSVAEDIAFSIRWRVTLASMFLFLLNAMICDRSMSNLFPVFGIEAVTRKCRSES